MLRAAVHSPMTRGKDRGKAKLRRICDKIAAKAMQGEPWACCLVFDRLDGKAHQSIDSSVTVEAGQVFVDLLRAINDARHAKAPAPQAKVIQHSVHDKPAAKAGLVPIGPAAAAVVATIEAAEA